MNACTRRCVLCFRHSRSEPEPINTGDSCRVHWRGFRCWLYTLTMKTDVSGCEWVCCPEWKTYWTLSEVFNRLPRQQCSPFSSPTGKSKIPWNIKGPIFSVILTFCLFVAKGSFDLRDPVPLIEPVSESNFLNSFKHAELSCSRSNPAEHTNRQGSLFP